LIGEQVNLYTPIVLRGGGGREGRHSRERTKAVIRIETTTT